MNEPKTENLFSSENEVSVFLKMLQKIFIKSQNQAIKRTAKSLFNLLTREKYSDDIQF
jgi:hypothetical protein